VKFYLDEDLSPKISAALRRKGIDAVSVHEVGNTQVSDSEQLAYAARQGRCLVTRNARHFLALSREAINRQQPHAGILLCSPGFTGAEFRSIANRLVQLAKQFPRGLGPYDIFYL
jgi:predicted nuclease of predicted toxin-antitoxin system